MQLFLAQEVKHMKKLNLLPHALIDVQADISDIETLAELVGIANCDCLDEITIKSMNQVGALSRCIQHLAQSVNNKLDLIYHRTEN